VTAMYQGYDNMTRRGMMLIELVVAGALLGTLLVVCLQLISVAAARRRAADQQQYALLELGNIMERVTAQPWAALTPARVAQEKLSPSAERVLPGAELNIEVSTMASEPNAKRVKVAIRWQDRSGQLGAPLTIATWRYRIVD
jgi:Tfp pilus assembly protein PilE